MESDRPFTLENILRIEDCTDLTDALCPATQMPLWAIVRVAFLRTVVEEKLYTGSFQTLLQRGGRLRGLSQLASVAHGAWHNRLHRRFLAGRNDVLVVSKGLRLLKHDGRYFNALSDYFNRLADASVLNVEELHCGVWPFPRSESQRYLIADPYLFSAKAVGRLGHRRQRERSTGLMHLAADRLEQFTGMRLSAAAIDGLARILARGAASLPFALEGALDFLTRAAPSLILKEEACYGGVENLALIAAARERKIRTAEYQHGMISQGHYAYNYSGGIIANGRFAGLLPDFFLGFGRWWNRQINVPVDKIAIGYPHREEILRRLPRQGGSDVLVLGDGIDTDVTLRFARDLGGQLDGRLRVVFRPHPIERERTRDVMRGGDYRRISADFSGDIYTAFAKSYAVIGEVSTGLFEAAGIVSNVFVWSTPKTRFSFPSHPFVQVGNASEFGAKLNDSYPSSNVSAIRDLWEEGWEVNYQAFVASILGK